jgi:hypothetical protein
MQGGDRDSTSWQPWRTRGEWLRCALHAHTTESDGELAPDLLAAHYARAGYDVLAVTDHWKRTEATAEGILVVPGVELNCVLPGGRDGHVLGFGPRCEPAELEAQGEQYGDLESTADWIRDRGGVAYLAHPYWTGVTPGALELPANVTGIEVYNAGCELEVGRGLSAVHWDELAERGRLCPAIATDDSHHPGFDSDFAWIWLRAEERTTVAVLEALERGSFYSSTGPMLRDVSCEDGHVEVACSSCRSIVLLSGRQIGAAVNAGRLGYVHRGRVLETDGDGLVRARLEIPPSAGHVRVEVTDAAGRKAWANPFTV